MRLSYKYRLYPTQKQEIFLSGQLAEACSLYNAALEERIGARKIQRKSISYYDQHSQLKAMREDGCLSLINFNTATDTLRRLDKTFKAFFGRVKRGEKPGFPRFRSAARYDSITFPKYGNGCKLIDGKLRLQGAGHIKIKLHRTIEGTIKTVTIKREAGRWFAIFSVVCDAKPLPVSDTEVGIDMGLTNFVVMSDGTEVARPRHAKDAQARLRRCQRKVARRKKGSARRRKAVIELQRAYAHVVNQRADFHHKLSRKIVDSFGLIAVEDLNIKGLASGMLAKEVGQAGWGNFINQVSYKAECAGRVLVKVDPRGTSQTCVCGASVPKALGDRWHSCPVCGLSASRDHVSAQVILQRGRIDPSWRNVENSCVPRVAVASAR